MQKAAHATSEASADRASEPRVRIGHDPVWTWTALFLLFTALGLLKFSYFYLDDLARGRTGTAGWRSIEELTGGYSAFVLLPLIVWFARKFSWRRTQWVH